MPEPYVLLNFAIIGESHGVGVGTAAFGGAAAGFGGAGNGAGEAGFSAGTGFSADAFRSDCTDPDVVAFTPPGTAGFSAVGFGSPSGGVEEGDLASSDIAANARTSGAEGSGENVNFYQLEDTVSTFCAEK
jgi:hypothetical protein